METVAIRVFCRPAHCGASRKGVTSDKGYGKGVRGGAMKFNDPIYNNALQNWSGHPDAKERACAHNLMFEERVSKTRRERLESRLSPADAHPVELRRRLLDHYWETVRDAPDSAETFTDANAAARFEEVSPEVWLVRLELLNDALDLYRIDHNTFVEAFTQNDRGSRAVVDKFIRGWNADSLVSGMLNPICFAAKRDSVWPELKSADWAEQLRNRFGLAHYDSDRRGPLVVALMEYQASEVAASLAARPGFAHAFAIPTALESEPYSQFFPTPVEMQCGCPMALTPIESEDELIAEVVHPRMPYRRKHFSRITMLDSALPASDFAECRNMHLLALQIASRRDATFGAEV